MHCGRSKNQVLLKVDGHEFELVDEYHGIIISNQNTNLPGMQNRFNSANSCMLIYLKQTNVIKAIVSQNKNLNLQYSILSSMDEKLGE